MINFLFLFVILGAYIFAFVLWKISRKLKDDGNYKGYFFIGINLLLGVLGAIVITYQADFIKYFFDVTDGYPYSLAVMIIMVLALKLLFNKSNIMENVA